MGGDAGGVDALEGKLLAAALDGGQHLVDLGGGQDEHQMLRRFLQDLEQGVEGLIGQHVDLVDDVHPLFHRGGGVDRFIQDGADVVHAVVGGGVQLQHVQNGTVENAQAGGALVAGVAVLGMFAVDGPGQQLGAGGLARSPGAGKQISVGQTAGGHLPLQGLGDVVLAYDLVEGFGAPLTIQSLVHSQSHLEVKKMRSAFYYAAL